MKFCTVINCIDGRIQLPVISFLKERFNVEYVDSITEAGPNLILAEHKDEVKINSIFERLEISINKHDSIGIAVVGHFDCGGNPATKEEQLVHTKRAVEFLKIKYTDVDIIGLWVDKDWIVNEMPGI